MKKHQHQVTAEETETVAIEVIDTLEQYIQLQNISSNIDVIIESGATELQVSIINAILENIPEDADEAISHASTLSTVSKSMIDTNYITTLDELRQYQGNTGYTTELVTNVLNRVDYCAQLFVEDALNNSQALDSDVASNLINTMTTLMEMRELINETEYDGARLGRKQLSVGNDIIQALLIGYNSGDEIQLSNDFIDTIGMKQTGANSENVILTQHSVQVSATVVESVSDDDVDVTSMQFKDQRSPFNNEANTRRRLQSNDNDTCSVIILGFNVSDSDTLSERDNYPLCTYFDPLTNDTEASNDNNCYVLSISGDSSYVECACVNTSLTYFALSFEVWDGDVDYTTDVSRFDSELMKIGNEEGYVGLLFVLLWIFACLGGMYGIIRLKNGNLQEQIFDDLPIFVAIHDNEENKIWNLNLKSIDFWTSYRAIMEAYIMRSDTLLFGDFRVLNLWLISLKNDHSFFGICCRGKGTNLNIIYRGLILMCKVLLTSSIMALFYPFNYDTTEFGDWSIVFLESFLTSIVIMLYIEILTHSNIFQLASICKLSSQQGIGSNDGKQQLEMAIGTNTATQANSEDNSELKQDFDFDDTGESDDNMAKKGINNGNRQEDIIVLQELENRTSKLQYKYDVKYGNLCQVILILMILTCFILTII